VVSGVVFVYYCGPALMGTPFDVYVQKHGFSQTVIGYMNMAGGVGHVIGAFVYAWLGKRLTFKQLVYWSCALGAIAQASFALLIDPWTAVAVNLVAGMCGMLAVCALLTLAADSCPDGSEGFTYAILNSIRNAATPVAGWIGSYMFDNMFSQQLVWIALASGLVTAAGILLLPMLDFGKQGKPPSGPTGPSAPAGPSGPEAPSGPSDTK
jgi:predicted MFS family arabinose efflux permease